MTGLSIAWHLLEAQPIDAGSLNESTRDLVVVSAAMVAGTWEVVSRFGDDSWVYQLGPTNRRKTFRTLNFQKVPAQFRNTAKLLTYRYSRRGLDGGAQPSFAALRQLFDSSIQYYRYLETRGILKLEQVTPESCLAYARSMRSHESPHTKRQLKTATIEKRLLAVEYIFQLSQFTSDRMPEHPWEDSSSYVLSGAASRNGIAGKRSRKTPLIPDEVFSKIFQAAHEVVKKSGPILDLRDKLEEFSRSKSHLSESGLNAARNTFLDRSGWSGGLAGFQYSLLEIRTATYIVIASLSGCRNHELAHLCNGAYYSTTDNDGIEYWWMRSVSTKTGAGRTVWMIPPAAVDALRTAERLAASYQAQLTDEISKLISINPRDPEIAEAERHKNSLFLGSARKKGNSIRTLSVEAWNTNINEFAKNAGINWHFGSHQFRRKFANYVARSKFGDLRYLREHFKHWLIDMTSGYALNEAQELALYAEIWAELQALKEDVVEQWLEPHTPLTGGYGRGIMIWRGSEKVQLFRSRKDMVKAIAKGTPIRGIGHAWCTAPDDACKGNGRLESTRCADGCNNAVISPKHIEFYRGLREQNLELLKCDDIGPGGLERVRRDLEICDRTLKILEIPQNG